MTLMTADRSLSLDPVVLASALPGASAHIVILVHGLALSELSWQRGGKPDIGLRLARELGHTPLYLRYNTGRHISTNGREFAALLETLCAVWPIPVESISLVGHSMGGLVIRSACWYADREQARWIENLRRVVCLGTPHHGSHLERAGHLLDRALLATPYTAPLAYGRKRSAGIKDLRHGNLLDEDWLGRDPDVHGDDNRRPVPLLDHVDYFFAAATLGKHPHDPIGHLLGDLLVRLGSAVGSHPDDLRRVRVKPEHCRVFHEQDHFDLLDDQRVHRQVVEWFGGSTAA
jgi:pimeloyl-ACP methyl ester carboxylesterase